MQNKQKEILPQTRRKARTDIQICSLTLTHDMACMCLNTYTHAYIDIHADKEKSPLENPEDPLCLSVSYIQQGFKSLCKNKQVQLSHWYVICFHLYKR